MCFSATASFTAAAVLAPVGAYCLRRAINSAPRSVLFAAFPLIFAVQQAFEGFVWLGVHDPTPGTTAAAFAFLFFSHFFWLWWVPLAAWYMQPPGKSRTACLMLTIVGGLYGASLYLPLLMNEGWMAIKVVDGSISYMTRHIYADVLSRPWVHGLYALSVIPPLFLQTDRHVRIFGGFVVVSMLIASREFAHAYISVWCFYAAVASGYLVLMLHSREFIATSRLRLALR